ncbi:ATPase [Sorangium cellulosum]|uniref:ATPase n=1 Tax=Sorangium cellulosum TaxID=56 RepID=A0A150RQQ4_SORCE|nr:ATPase [Sorangium cellulosum]KYF96312.1 ATPase [Sorangium cellulosum]
MPIKSDAKRRWVELELIVPGTPEQVWRAIATGPGISAWFAPTTADERVGGKIEFTFGEGAASSGTITAWEPPSRLEYEEHGWSEGAPPLATEFVVSGRSGGECLVRLVHSLFTSKDAWDDEIEGFESGWPGFFRVLRLYLRHFADQRAAAARAMSAYPGAHAEAWKQLATALGVSGPNLGERRSAPAGAPPLVGTVEHVEQSDQTCEVLLRLEQPAQGVALLGSYPWEDKARIAVSLFFYGDRAAETAAELEPRWRAWLEARFPANAAQEANA